MSGKKEHKKGGKQYRQERKRKTSEEDSMMRRNEKELERIDDKPTPVIEGHNSEDDSDELQDVQLWRTSYNNFQSFSGPPPSSHWEYS